jgi:hypothetical protein
MALTRDGTKRYDIGSSFRTFPPIGVRITHQRQSRRISMQEKLKGLAQRLDGLATRFQLHGQFAAADDVRRVATELKAMAGVEAASLAATAPARSRG